MISSVDRIRDILHQRDITILQFSDETGIDRANFFYRKTRRKSHQRCRYIYMAIAYYFDMTLEELLTGTDMEDLI